MTTLTSLEILFSLTSNLFLYKNHLLKNQYFYAIFISFVHPYKLNLQFLIIYLNYQSYPSSLSLLSFSYLFSSTHLSHLSPHYYSFLPTSSSFYTRLTLFNLANLIILIAILFSLMAIFQVKVISRLQSKLSSEYHTFKCPNQVLYGLFIIFIQFSFCVEQFIYVNCQFNFTKIFFYQRQQSYDLSKIDIIIFLHLLLL